MNNLFLLFDNHNLEYFELIGAIVVFFLILLALIDIGAFSSSDQDQLKLGGVGLLLGFLGVVLLIVYVAIPFIIVGALPLLLIFLLRTKGRKSGRQ